jgi:hypothetical protein
MAISVGTKAAALLVFAFVVAPAIGFGLKRLTGGWDSYGGGAFGILKEEPAHGREAPTAVDPAIQAAEVRQMLEAKAARRRERGGPEIDVEAESARLLAAAEAAPAARDEALRAEVRQLVVARNERRRRQGLEPLDVEAETARQLAELAG